MIKIIEKEQALLLRKQGVSIGDIAKLLKVSKSTTSGWCRNIKMSDLALKKIAQKSSEKSTLALLKYSESQRTLRQKNIITHTKEGRTLMGAQSNRDIFCVGIGLYWGEGYKNGNQECGFTNSDSKMVLFYISWLKNCFSVEKNNLTLRVSINETHHDRINDVEKYWSEITKIPLDQFTKSSLIKSASKKVCPHREGHMGTLRIKVQNGTALRRKILGAISQIRD